MSFVPKNPLREAARPRFTSANVGKILALKPNLVLIFSDLQADIAAGLIRRGLNVHASNQAERKCSLRSGTIRWSPGLGGLRSWSRSLVASTSSPIVRTKAQPTTEW